MCVLSHLIMSSLGSCVVCMTAWLFKRFLNQYSYHLCDSGHSVKPTVSVSPSGRGEWKGAELNADLSLSISFGCRWIWFNLPIASSSELVAMHPCCSSAFDVLLANAARCNDFFGKPKLFFLKHFSQLTSPNFLGSQAKTQSIFGLALCRFQNCAKQQPQITYSS